MQYAFFNGKPAGYTSELQNKKGRNAENPLFTPFLPNILIISQAIIPAQ